MTEAAAQRGPAWWLRIKKVYADIPPLPRDILIAVLVIGLVMGTLWTYTGQPLNQAPLVVVESGSMMHEDAGYGRVGTIDPGDLILVKEAAAADVVTLYGGRASGPADHPGEGGRDGYGAKGDVLIYRQDQCGKAQTTPIIHRAITWVEVRETSTGRVFSYHDASGVWHSERPNVDLPEIGLAREDAFRVSGWITKGDNVRTNQQADQTGICPGRLIQSDWLIGKARGEIPWIGLLKFMVQGNNVNSVPADWCEVGRAVAPCDLFRMLWITLIIVIAVPLAWDVTNRIRRRMAEDAAAAEPEADDVQGDEPPAGPPAAGADKGPRWSDAAKERDPKRPL